MRVTSPRILACLLFAMALLLVTASPASACSSCIAEEGSECGYSLFFTCMIIHFQEPPRCINFFCGEVVLNRNRGASTIHQADGSNRPNATQCAPAALLASNLSLGPRQFKIIRLSQLHART
jgi:hypothetical protein